MVWTELYSLCKEFIFSYLFSVPFGKWSWVFISFMKCTISRNTNNRYHRVIVGILISLDPVIMPTCTSKLGPIKQEDYDFDLKWESATGKWWPSSYVMSLVSRMPGVNCIYGQRSLSFWMLPLLNHWPKLYQVRVFMSKSYLHSSVFNWYTSPTGSLLQWAQISNYCQVINFLISLQVNTEWLWTTFF